MTKKPRQTMTSLSSYKRGKAIKLTAINENLDMTDKANLALTQRDFTRMAQRYKNFKDKGAQAEWINQPDNLVRKTKDKFKMLHYCMIAAIFG